MSKIDDILTKSAKQIVSEIEDRKIAGVQTNENDNTVDIKLAKAKSGARRHINRTVRICTVAAVLMVGLVCALFMGAKEDLDPETIKFTKEAYMRDSNDPESIWNGDVIVDIDLSKIGEWTPGYNGENVDLGAIYEGKISIKDVGGKSVYEVSNIKMTYHAEGNVAYYDGIESVKVVKDENTGKMDNIDTTMDNYQMLLSISFNKDMDEFEIRLWEKIDIAAEKYPERLDENGFYYPEKYSIYVKSEGFLD